MPPSTRRGRILEHLAAALIGQHPYPQLGVGGVHRDVDRADVHLDDALNLVVLHVGHGDVVAIQKGKPLIIILKIKALAHTRGQLVDEAEHAVVGAGLCFSSPRYVLKLQPKGPRSARCTPEICCLSHLCLQVKAAAVGIKLIVQRIVQLVLIHGQQRQPGSRPKPRLRCPVHQHCSM